MQLKKELVKQREIIVVQACEKLFNENINISYRNISEITNIPKKTLERNPYKEIISVWRNKNRELDKQTELISRYEKEIKYLNKVIAQLRKENSNLRTEVYYLNK